MAAKKDNKTSLYLLALIGIAGYIVYNKFKKDKEMKELREGDKDIDTFDESYFTEERGRSFVSKELYENKDPEFMEHVRHLQQKLNDALKKLDPSKTFPFYPLKVDGLLGWRTALAIARVYGEGYVPIKDKKTIVYLYTNFE
jgi:hypothetical protein